MAIGFEGCMHGGAEDWVVQIMADRSRQVEKVITSNCDEGRGHKNS